MLIENNKKLIATDGNRIGPHNAVTQRPRLFVVYRFVEFKYNLGNGAVILTSLHPITIGSRHKIVAKRYQKDGLLQFEDYEPVRSVSMGSLRSLDLNDNAYVGYVPIVHKKWVGRTPKRAAVLIKTIFFFFQDIREHWREIGADRMRALDENRSLLGESVGFRGWWSGDELGRRDGMPEELFERHLRLFW